MPASELIDEKEVEESYTPTYNNYTGHSQKPTPDLVYYDGNF